MTITEALAEIKLISNKVEKKQAAIRTFLTRQEALKDPLAKDGGSAAYIQQEQQAIADLQDRKVKLRLAIADANRKTPVTVGQTTRPIAEWLLWRREIAPTHRNFLTTLRATIDQARRQAVSTGGTLVAAGQEAAKPGDIVVNLNEARLGKETEWLTETLDLLDGQLSLKNATVLVEV